MARGAPLEGCGLHTEVVLTPLSKAGVAGEGAGGVSIHSKFSSDVDPFILLVVVNFARRSVRNSGQVLAEVPSRIGVTLSAQSSRRTGVRLCEHLSR